MIANISIIVAITKDFAIGKNNDLLVSIPGDLKRFKEITTGHSLIMGRNTLLSLPKWPLPNRRNIVISDQPGEQFDGCEMANSIEAAVELVKGESEAFVMGGGMIYKQFYPLASKLYLTVVDQHLDADTFFPEVVWEDWNVITEEKVKKGERCDFAFTYLNLERK